jgi:hypothetical protein
MGLLRTAFVDRDDEKILRVYIKEYPESLDIPLIPRHEFFSHLL